MSSELARLNTGGRPAYWGDRKTSTIGFPEALYARIKEEAEAYGFSLSEYVSLCLGDIHGMDLPDPRPNLRRTRPRHPPALHSREEQLPLGA